MNGENVVLCSGTGSGKTEAILAPMLSRLWDSAFIQDSPIILYIAPTKALINDLEKRLTSKLSVLNLKVGIRHGDRDDTVSGKLPNVLVTTPESLDVMLFRQDKALSQIKGVVLDEVHLLYNTQRGLHLSILLKRLKHAIGSNYQWAALSATIGRLSDIRDSLFGPAEPATFIEYPSSRPIDAHVRHVGQEKEFLKLVSWLTEGRDAKLLIFANTRRECERLAGILNSDERLRPHVFAHYSSLSPEVRIETEMKFALSNIAVCVATSTLELGIDIGDIDVVLLWGVPGGVESFLQRIGRGNRRANKSNVVCLIPDSSQSVVQDALRFLTLIDAASKGEMPSRYPYDLYGAAAQQCLNTIVANGGDYTRVADLVNMFDHKGYLGRPIIEAILGELASKEYLQRHGFKNRYGADQELYRLVDYKLIYGNFSLGSQTIEVRFKSKALGTVPAINLLRIRSGATVRFAGQVWHVRSASTDGIIVEPSRSRDNAIDFMYLGGAPRFDSFLSNRMWSLIHSSDPPLHLLSPQLRQLVEPSLMELREACSLNTIPTLYLHGPVQYLTFAGQLVNTAIALIAGQTEFKADDISLSVPQPIRWATVPQEPKQYESIFHLLLEADSDQSIYQTLLPKDLQLTEFLQGWLKDDTIPVVLNRLANSLEREVDRKIYEAFEIVPCS